MLTRDRRCGHLASRLDGTNKDARYPHLIRRRPRNDFPPTCGRPRAARAGQGPAGASPSRSIRGKRPGGGLRLPRLLGQLRSISSLRSRLLYATVGLLAITS